MILFVAPNPFKTKEHEGYLQRVAAIDALFEGEEKCYSGDCRNSDELAKYIIKADLIYVHSIYRAEEIIDCYPVFGTKIITDLHGVVPEEEELIGETRRSKELDYIESIVMANGKAFVVVTDAMKDHFKKKYGYIANKPYWITLPIFDEKEVGRSEKRDIVVYAGGAQKWQNTDLIVDIVNSTDNGYAYTLLTHSLDAFDSISKEKTDMVTLKSVTSDEVGSYYQDAKFGFILRDDTTVNNVACPTKLIEYLTYGIVPIIKSPKIGDFEKHGYAYATVEQYKRGDLDDVTIQSYRIQNYKVIDELKSMTKKGKQSLRKTAKGIISKSNKALNIEHLVSSACQNSIARRDLGAANYQISEQIRMIHEYADAVTLHRKELSRLRSSKVYRFAKKARDSLSSWRSVSK